MTWNGVHFNLHTIIPWPVIVIWAVLYFGLLAWAWTRGSRNGVRLFGNFKTIDFVYIALLSALLIVYNFFISPLVPKVGSITTYFYYPEIGEMFILLLAVALVGKPGSAGLTIFIYTLLSDIVHYGFGGEPFYFIYEVLAYGAVIDMWLIYRGKYYMTDLAPVRRGAVPTTAEAIEDTEENVRKALWLLILDGIIGGATIMVAYNFWYLGFFRTFISGLTVNVTYWEITSLTSLGGGALLGLILAPIIYYVKRVVS